MWLQGWQCFFIVILAFVLAGFMRGWRREIVSLAFTLAGVLIVALGGGYLIAQAIFVRLPVVFQDPNNLHAPGPPSTLEITIVTALTLIVLVALGYLTGNKAFPRPTTAAERLWGIIPAITAGVAVYAILGRLSATLNKNPMFTFAIPNPGPGMIGNYLLLIFIVLVVLVIIGLVTSSAKKSSGAKPK